MRSWRRAYRALGLAALSASAFVTALVLCEVAARIVDRQPVLALRLGPTPRLKRAPARKLDPTIGGGTLPADIDPSWIDALPPRRPRIPPDPALVAAGAEAQRRGAKPFDAFRIWNRVFVEQVGCTPGTNFPLLPEPLLVFDPPEALPYPPYRYPPSKRLFGLTTNRFGWRGPDIPVDKPPGTIRLAFAGASTTVGIYTLAFSYPEYVVHWLNLWAKRNAPSVHFDGINAGREGLSSAPIAAVIRQEVLPAEPDLVLYYEGANESLCARRVPVKRPRSAVWELTDRFAVLATPHSELARYLQGVALTIEARGGYEPDKPASDLRWSPDLNELHPDIKAASLPPISKLILDNLESARAPVEGQGGVFALSSFVWLVAEGLRLDPHKYLPIYRHLNEHCWPFSYADIRRSVDLHNHILERYAAAHALPFIQIAAQFPLDPELFFDAVHLNDYGTRLHAWIVFRALIPIVRAHLASGEWPRPDRVPMSEHPAIGPGRPYTLKCEGKEG